MVVCVFCIAKLREVCVYSACLLSLCLYVALGSHSEAYYLLAWDVACHFKPN